MKELDNTVRTEHQDVRKVLTLTPGPKSEGGRNTFYLRLSERPNNQTYELTTPESENLGSIVIHNASGILRVDCNQCPKLNTIDGQARWMKIQPHTGEARQRINDQDTLIITGYVLMYKPSYLSKKRSAKHNKYGKWLSETRRDRLSGFVK